MISFRLHCMHFAMFLQIFQRWNSRRRGGDRHQRGKCVGVLRSHQQVSCWVLSTHWNPCDVVGCLSLTIDIFGQLSNSRSASRLNTGCICPSCCTNIWKQIFFEHIHQAGAKLRPTQKQSFVQVCVCVWTSFACVSVNVCEGGVNAQAPGNEAAMPCLFSFSDTKD